MSKPKPATAPAPVVEAAQPAEAVAESTEVDDGIFRPKTTKELFAHDRAAAKALLNPPAPEPAPKEPEIPAVLPAEVPQEAAPEPEVQPAEAPLTPEEAIKKWGIDPTAKAKVKIDGEEREVTFGDLVRGYQTDQHLSKRGNKISAERQELERIRQELRQELSQAKPRSSEPASPEEIAPSDDPFVLQLQKEVAELREIKASLAPILYDRAREELAEKLKEEGFSNFKEYLPRIQKYVLDAPSEQFDYYNTPEGATALYFRFLAEDARNQVAKPPAPVAPVKPAMERPRPPIIRIPDSSAPGIAVTDDKEEKLAAAMKRYQESGNKDKRAWETIMQLKGLA